MDVILKALYQPYKWLFVIPFMVLSTLFHSIVCMVVVLLFGADAGDLVAVSWARLTCVAAPIRVKIRGKHNYSREKSYVVVANHQSLVDIPVLHGWLGLKIKWIMKKELKKVPFFGPACQSLGCIYIDRSDNEAAIKSMAEARLNLTKKSAVFFFAEGTRSRDGRLLPFKKGAFIFALEAGIPILPITIKNSRQILPPDSLDLYPGEVEIIVHPAVDMAEYGFENLNETIAKVRNTIQQAL